LPSALKTIINTDGIVRNLPRLLYISIASACFVIPSCAYGGDGRLSLGISFSGGVSGFHGHKAQYIPNLDGYAVAPKPAISGGAGLAAAFIVNGILTTAAEPQYSLYRVHSKFYIKTDETATKEPHTAGAELHSLELPLLARFNINPIYIETGVQPGANLYAQIRRDGESETPGLNRLAAGVTAGFGAVINNNTTIGLRGYYSLTEYDKNSHGYPWTVRVSATQYFHKKGGRI
jgi:hypothetical protein